MRAGPWRRTVDANTSNEAKARDDSPHAQIFGRRAICKPARSPSVVVDHENAMQAQTTQPRGFVTPVVTEIVPPWRRPRPR
jgi:hypothetical protein